MDIRYYIQWSKDRRMEVQFTTIYKEQQCYN